MYHWVGPVWLVCGAGLVGLVGMVRVVGLMVTHLPAHVLPG